MGKVGRFTIPYDGERSLSDVLEFPSRELKVKKPQYEEFNKEERKMMLSRYGFKGPEDRYMYLHGF